MDLFRRQLIAAPLLAQAAIAARANPAPAALRIAAIEKHPTSVVCWHVLAEVYRQAGLQLQVEPLPVAHATRAATGGLLDGELCRIHQYNADKPELLRAELPYYLVRARAYSMPDQAVTVETPADLWNYRAGLMRGVVFAHLLTDKHPTLTQAVNAEQLYRLLQARRVDLVLDTPAGARTAAEALGLRELRSSPDLAAFELFRSLHLRHQALVPRIGDALRRLAASGELARLLAHHEATVTLDEVRRFAIPTPPSAL